MLVVTLVTRFGGVFLMSFVRINPGREFINTMGSVLIAIIVPLVDGDLGALAALVATAAMLATRKPLPSITVGLLAAAWCVIWVRA